MLRRALLGLALIAAVSPAQAQSPVEPPADCTVDLDVRPGPQLEVDLRCRSARPLTFTAEDRRTMSHLSGLATTDREARYRFDLKGFAAEVDSTSIAVARGDGVLATLGSWLLEPQGFERPPTIDIRVRAADGQVFAAGLPRAGEAWRLSGMGVRLAGYTAIGSLFLQELAVPAPGSLRPNLANTGAPKEDGVLRLVILDGTSPGARADLADWVKRTAEAEANWWQGYPARQSLVALVPTNARRATGYGRTVSGGGPTVMVEVGREVDRRRLFDDWVLVHEVIHTGMPYLRGRATWFMEGAATYIEPVLRARAGWISEADVWREWTREMPQGAAVFAAGLGAATGRQNYWAGALFMLLADIGLRRDTDGAKGLEDCLAGALWDGFDGSKRTTLQDYAAACDHAVGSDTMSRLVARHMEGGQPMDLDALWRALGVRQDGHRILFDDAAPLARWRKMIVLGPNGSKLKPVRLPWRS